MMRRERRPHDRQEFFQDAPTATNVIKLGWTVTKQKRDNSGTFDMPVRLPGFLVCINTVGRDGKFVIDEPVMKQLGYPIEKIRAVLADPEKAEVGTLPTDLLVVIGYDSVREGDTWSYPNTYAEEYSLYDKLGLKCKGDGVWANRRQDDGSRRKIACRVRGCNLGEGESHCEFSLKKECRPHGRLVVRLAMQDGHGGFKPLSGVANATWRIDTGSDYGLANILSELDRVSDKLAVENADGSATAFLTGLVATLAVRRERKRYVESGVGKVSIVPQLHLVFDEAMVLRREAELFSRSVMRRGHVIEAAPVRPQLAHEPGVPTADELAPLHVDDDANRDGNLGHVHDDDDVIDAQAEPEGAGIDDVPTAAGPDFDQMAVEFEDRCNEVCLGTDHDWRDAFEFYASAAGSKRPMRGPVTLFFRYASDKPEANPEYHAGMMRFLAECHRIACVEKRPFALPLRATA